MRVEHRDHDTVDGLNTTPKTYWFYTFIIDIIKVDVDIYLCATWLLRTTSAMDIYHLPSELDIYHSELEKASTLYHWSRISTIYRVPHMIVAYCYHRLYRTKKLKLLCAHASSVRNIVEYGIINDGVQHSELHVHFKDRKEYDIALIFWTFSFLIFVKLQQIVSTMSGMRSPCRVSGIRMYSRYL